jgi:hypothetical protein
MTISYINYYRWTYRQDVSICQSVGNSVGISDLSLYSFLCLNPTVILSVKASTKKYFFIFKIFPIK